MIDALSDPDALRLLSAIAGAHLLASPAASHPAPSELLASLAETFGSLIPGDAAPTDGDLARAALALAADDPATARHLEGMIALGPPVMGVGSLVLAFTAALTILQTELTFERASTGKYRVRLHRRAASDPLLRRLAHVVMKALPGGASRPAE
jgi:hypothetical protein